MKDPSMSDAKAAPSLSERLKTLKVDQSSAGPSKTATNSSSDAPEASSIPTTKPSSTLAGGTTLTHTLIQALHSSDNGLLESCFSHTDPKLIRDTVKRLPTQLVLPLVDSLVERLGRNKKGTAAGTGGANAQRGREIVLWLRGVLVVHIGYLLTVSFFFLSLPTLSFAFSFSHETISRCRLWCRD
jgi:U3 small nucleolar RNA-associated protein 5